MFTRLAVGMAAVTMLLSGSAEGADAGRSSLVVRSYTATSLDGIDWPAAIHEARTILNDVDIDVDWLDCSATGVVPSRCAQPMAVNEVAIRLVRGPAVGDPRKAVLGESMLDAPRRAGTLATIYVYRVRWLADTARVATHVLLARAIAHEIGHLLMGTPVHSRGGLMRAIWTRSELVTNHASDWMFPADDAVRLRVALERRLLAPDSRMVTGDWEVSSKSVRQPVAAADRVPPRS